MDVVVEGVGQLYLDGVDEFDVLGLRAFGEGYVVIDIAIIEAWLHDCETLCEVFIITIMCCPQHL
jgi:hypothetical protein